MVSRINNALRPLGAELVRADLSYDGKRFNIHERWWNECTISADAAGYLKADNPKLLDLQRRYDAFDADVTTPFVWTERHLRAEDLTYFRGNNAWVRQVRRRGARIDTLAYTLTLYYLKSVDSLSLLDKLTEDDSFGNFTFTLDDRPVSRDLLDSIAEIYFLNRHLDVALRSPLRVLDIGAGYGRLAHRMAEALPGIESILCTDAVAVSTFVSEYYLHARNVKKASVIALDEIDDILREHPVDLAINIHSFSECRPQAIEWWARLLSTHQVKHLMIVPNAGASGGQRLMTDDGHDMLPLLERHGYRMVVKEPKFLNPIVQEYGVEPTWHHLLELRGQG